MCYNCGCMLPDDPMGDDRNIINKTFDELAKKKGKTTDEVKRWALDMLEKDEEFDADLEEMFVQASKAWGQPVSEAKNNTKELLKETLR